MVAQITNTSRTRKYAYIGHYLVRLELLQLALQRLHVHSGGCTHVPLRRDRRHKKEKEEIQELETAGTRRRQKVPERERRNTGDHKS